MTEKIKLSDNLFDCLHVNILKQIIIK